MLVGLGLLILRVVVGLTLAGHGAQKLFGWWGGSGMTGWIAVVNTLRIRPAAPWAWIAAFSEFGGGLLLALGLLSPLGSLAIAGTMLVAVATVHWANGFWNTKRGNVVTSTNPTGGAAAWTVTSVGAGRALSCPSTNFCVAVGGGDATISINPTGGAAAWKVTHIDNACCNSVTGDGGTLLAVSCPSNGLCVAADDSGNVVTSSNPTGGAAAWTVTNVDSSTSLNVVSCPTIDLCVAVDGNGRLVTTTNPNGGAGAWAVTSVTGAGSLTGLSCPSAHLCVAVGDASTVLTSTNPTGGAAAWKVTKVPTIDYVSGVSCPSSALCVAVDERSGNMVTSTNPTGGPTAWKSTGMGFYPSIISCPTITFCTAVEFRGTVATSKNPTGGKGAWKKIQLSGVNYVYGVSCAGPSLCVLVNGEVPGNDAPAGVIPPASSTLVSSSNPTGSASTWVSANVAGADFVHGISCPSVSFCVAVDNAGNVITSSQPAGGKAAWTVINVDGRNSLRGVSCPTTFFCVVVDGVGNVIIGTRPA